MMSADGVIREVEVEAETHGAAKVRLKGDVARDERLLFIRVLED